MWQFSDLGAGKHISVKEHQASKYEIVHYHVVSFQALANKQIMSDRFGPLRNGGGGSHVLFVCLC